MSCAGPESGATFDDVSPITQTVIAAVADASPADVDAAADSASAAPAQWRATPITERAALVRAFADLVEVHREELATLDTVGAGSPINNGRLDVDLALRLMRMFAGLALEMKGETVPASNNLHLTVREPVGCCGEDLPVQPPVDVRVWPCRTAGGR